MSNAPTSSAVRVLALLQPPSNQSFGMVPVLVKDEFGTFRASGFAPGPYYGRTFSEPEAMELARRTMPCPEGTGVVLAPIPDNACALVLGDVFDQRARNIGLPVWMSDDMEWQSAVWLRLPGLRFRLLGTADAYAALAAWTDRAFLVFRSEREKPEPDHATSVALAGLMKWCQPTSQKTRAAEFELAGFHPDPLVVRDRRVVLLVHWSRIIGTAWPGDDAYAEQLRGLLRGDG